MGKVSKTIFFDTCVSLGYCCARKMLEANDKVRVRDLAKKLGFVVRTVYYWRRAFRDGGLYPCAGCRHTGPGKPLL
jgi:hypothetical protein